MLSLLLPFYINCANELSLQRPLNLDPSIWQIHYKVIIAASITLFVSKTLYTLRAHFEIIYIFCENQFETVWNVSCLLQLVDAYIV